MGIPHGSWLYSAIAELILWLLYVAQLPIA